MANRHTPLPPALAARWGHLNHLQYKGSGEWSSECPVCGSSGHVGSSTPDRFFISEAGVKGNARGQCRQCGHFEWADQNESAAPDPARILEQEEHRRAMQQREALRLKAKIKRLQEKEYWKAWHDSMTQAQRAIWEKAGIPTAFQDRWEFGYTEAYRGYTGGEAFQSPALTIPYFAPGREAYNVQYRLLEPPQPQDRYRFSKGLDTGLWLADPDDEPTGTCLLCEGVKKAAVAYVEIVAKLSKPNLTIISAPAKRPKLDTLSTLAECDPIYIAFDPDAYETTRTAKGLRKPPAVTDTYKHLRAQGHDVRLVKLPMKLDDMLMLDGIDGNTVLNAMHRARVSA